MMKLAEKRLAYGKPKFSNQLHLCHPFLQQSKKPKIRIYEAALAQSLSDAQHSLPKIKNEEHNRKVCRSTLGH